MALLAVRKNNSCGSLFNNLTAVHNNNVVRHLVDNSEVVRDKHYRGAVFSLQVVHQTEYLRLNGNVKRRGRFVRYKNVGFAGKRHGYHNTLTHTARKLVRILSRNNFGVRYLNRAEHFDTFFRRFFLRHILVNHKRFGKLSFNRKDGVQARHRLLEDDRYTVAADMIHLLSGEL